MDKRLFVAGETPVSKKIQLRNFTHIRAFHGCRPVDIESYKTQGIIPITKHAARKDAILRLGGGSIPDEKILAAFESLWAKWDDMHKCVWFELTHDKLLNNCGHYMISGSEFILTLGQTLWYQHKLREIGTPTLLHCDVPTEAIPAFWLDSMQKDIIDKRLTTCAIMITGGLAPENIVEIEFPRRIPDPHNGYLEYRVH